MMELACREGYARVTALDEVMGWALEQYAADQMLVALRLNQIENSWRYSDLPAGKFFQSWFGSYIVTEFQAAEWPSTKLLGHPSFIYVVKFNEEVNDVILRTQPSLAKWQHKETPHR